VTCFPRRLRSAFGVSRTRPRPLWTKFALKRKALVGALRHDTADVLRSIADSLERLRRRTGTSDDGTALTRKLTSVVDATFGLAAEVPRGNAFANANKAFDHFFAYGPHAADAPGARIREGRRLPEEFVSAVGEILLRHNLIPVRGYLE
jgi:hypothetical protein